MILAFKKHPTAALIALVLLVVSAVLVANHDVLPRLDAQISARQIAQKLKEADPSLGHIATYKLSRNWAYGMNFYLNRQLPEWTSTSGEPDWILAGSFVLLDRDVMERYKDWLDGWSPDNHTLMIVYHRR
jgi:hypothetical protein